MEQEFFIGQQIDYLTIKNFYSENKIICQCCCGREVFVEKSTLYNKKEKKSCGCRVTKQDLPSLYNLWKNLSLEEKATWGKWDDFVIWSKKRKYYEVFSYYKPNRKLPYNKDNLLFGLFINKKFFSIEDLKRNRIYYNEESDQFVTSKREKNLIVTHTQITRLLSRQKGKHKTLPEHLFKKLT